MKKMKLFTLALLACFMGSSFIASAQQEARIKIQQNINGEIVEIDSTIQVMDKEDLDVEELVKELLKEHGIDENAMGDEVDIEKRIIIKKGDINGMDIDIDSDVDIHIDSDDDGAIKIYKFKSDGKEGEEMIERFMLGENQNGKGFSWVMHDNDKGYLGVVLDSNDDAKQGVTINRVEENSAASEAGLQDGDIISSVDGKAISTIDELVEAISSHKKGDEVKIEYIRDGKTTITTATLESRSLDIWSLHKEGNSPCGSNNNGMKMWTWEEEKYTQMGVYTDNTYELGANGGVLISKIVEDSGADKAGLQKGDLILKVDQDEINTNQSLTDNIRARKANDKITVTYKRSGEIRTVDVILQEATRSLKNWDKIQDFKMMGDPSMQFFKDGNVKIFADSIQFKTFEDMDLDVIKLLDKSPDADKLEEILEEQTKKMNRKSMRGKKGTPSVSSLTFYPNPNNGQFKIDFEVEDVMNTTVRVMDIAGQIVWEDQLGDFSGQYSKAVDISEEVGNGMYLLQIQRGDQVLTKKVAIQSNK